jgi:hypothetical protein
MTRMREAYNPGFSSSIQSDKHNLCHSPDGERQRQWERRNLVKSIWRCLLQVPHQGQADHDDADNDSVNNEDLQAVGLKIPDQPCDRGVSNDRGN